MRGKTRLRLVRGGSGGGARALEAWKNAGCIPGAPHVAAAAVEEVIFHPHMNVFSAANGRIAAVNVHWHGESTSGFDVVTPGSVLNIPRQTEYLALAGEGTLDAIPLKREWIAMPEGAILMCTSTLVLLRGCRCPFEHSFCKTPPCIEHSEGYNNRIESASVALNDGALVIGLSLVKPGTFAGPPHSRKRGFTVLRGDVWVAQGDTTLLQPTRTFFEIPPAEKFTMKCEIPALLLRVVGDV